MRSLGLLWLQLQKDARHPITHKPVCIPLSVQPTCDLKGDQARLSGCSMISPPTKCSSLKKLFSSCRAMRMKLPPAKWSVTRLKSTDSLWSSVQSWVGHQTHCQRMLHVLLCVHAGRKGHCQQLPSSFYFLKKAPLWIPLKWHISEARTHPVKRMKGEQKRRV